MRTAIKYRARVWVVMASVLVSVATPIMAETSDVCCPDDQHGAAATGLGQSSPSALDISLIPDWYLYVFAREDIRYLQVNDRNGTVRMAVGYVGDTFWVLPVGIDAVSTPQRPLTIPVGAVRSVVYRSLQFELAVYTGGRRVLWSVEVPAP